MSEKLRTENARLTAENERLRAENSQTYCAYCGQSFVRDDGAASLVGEHIRTCEKHPMRAVEAELKRARETENALRLREATNEKAMSAEVESLTEKNQRISKTNLRMLGINASLRTKSERLAKALESLRKEHDSSEDCWYSCPKSGDCCDESRDKNQCTCGTDRHNEIIDKALRGEA